MAVYFTAGVVTVHDKMNIRVHTKQTLQCTQQVAQLAHKQNNDRSQNNNKLYFTPNPAASLQNQDI